MIIEDNPGTRRTSVRLLESFGCDVVAAESADRAIAEVWALPRLDLVCADIGLDPRSAEDKSGIRVARTVREINPSIPLAAYSGKGFDLEKAERDLFDLVEIKGGGIGAEDLEEFFDDAVKLAREQSAKVRVDAREAATDPEERVLADLRHVLKRYVVDVSDPSEIEGALEAAGYQIRLVSPDACEGLRRPIIVWVQRDNEESIAQLFGASAFFAVGDNEEAAIAHLVVVLREELTDIQGASIATEREQELLDYLRLIVEPMA